MIGGNKKSNSRKSTEIPEEYLSMSAEQLSL